MMHEEFFGHDWRTGSNTHSKERIGIGYWHLTSGI